MDTQLTLIEYNPVSKNVKLSVHCYNIPFLKRIVEKFTNPEEQIKIFSYLYYTTCESISNPYFNYSIYEREFKVLADMECDFDIEDPLIVIAKKKLSELYELPSSKAYVMISEMLNQMANQVHAFSMIDMDPAKAKSLRDMALGFSDLKKQFDQQRRDMIVEEKDGKRVARNRGGLKSAYDD